MRIEHIGIAVSDVDAAVESYRALLGSGVYKSETVGTEGVRTYFLWADGVKIELLESIDKTSAIARFLKTRGEGLHHIAFAVRDLDRTREELERSGFEVIGSGLRDGADERRVFFIHPRSSHGVLVECCTDRRIAPAGSDDRQIEDPLDPGFVEQMPRLWIVCDGMGESATYGRMAMSLADDLTERLEPMARVFRSSTPVGLDKCRPTDRILVISGRGSAPDIQATDQTTFLELDAAGSDAMSAIESVWVVRSRGYSARLPISAVSPLDPVTDALTPLLLSQWEK
jgi:methylmalonyl-CoA/ethylmalonyl-CoA epimerase